MQIFKKVFIYLFCIFFIIYFVFFCLTFFGFDFGVVSSNSMAPLLKVGDVVVVNTHKQARQGDIIAFKLEGVGVVIHRVLRVDNLDGVNYYFCAGDNNAFFTDSAGKVDLNWQQRVDYLADKPFEVALTSVDNLVEQSEVIGTAIIKFDYLGRVAEVIKYAAVAIFIFALVLCGKGKMAKNKYFGDGLPLY